MHDNFQERHALIEEDTLAELKRRAQIWATAPDHNGNSLIPDAQIVPLATLHAAIAEIEKARVVFGCLEELAKTLIDQSKAT
jgi:hypothetical protein